MSAAADEEKSGGWTVHGEVGGRPSLRGFARTKVEAERLMATLEGEDAADAKSEYWLIELTRGALEDFRSFGMLPAGY